MQSHFFYKCFSINQLLFVHFKLKIFRFLVKMEKFRLTKIELGIFYSYVVGLFAYGTYILMLESSGWI
jgi:hypothetical protein